MKEDLKVISPDKNSKTDINANWKPGDKIGYIRSDIPDFKELPYKGEHYEAMVPDTLDLQERARLAIHAMTEATDPLADHEILWWVEFRSNPPQMNKKRQMPKFVEALPLMRVISGSEQNQMVEKKWMEVILKSLGDDGLFYKPLKGKPWDKPLFDELIERGANPDIDQWIDPFDNGRLLSAMTILATYDESDLWKNGVRKMVDGMNELALHIDGDMATFWPRFYAAFKEKPKNLDLSVDCSYQESSRSAHGLVHAYKLLGYEPAIILARKIIMYLRKYHFGEDGSFLGAPGTKLAHFHAHAHALLAMEEYAEVTGDKEMMDFVVKSYSYAKSLGYNTLTNTDYSTYQTEGSNLLGYFVEFTSSTEWEGSETCQVADMIALALRLSEAGVGDYWDEADRWIRNMFAEGQLLTTDWINRVPTEMIRNVADNKLPDTEIDPYGSSDRVAERNLGAFTGWAAVNDWHVGNGPGIMHCCTGNGAQAIYRIWERILNFKDGKLRVNLLLNRASKWADVNSHIPYTGKVDVNIKMKVDISIRIPEWVTPEETQCFVNGKERTLSWDGRYAIVGEVNPGDVATLTFPIFERIDIVHIEKERFTIVRKGNEVVSIDPPGRYCPLYQRQHYRANSTRWHYVDRYLSDNKLIKW